ncbi:MAG: methyl-accepting chemotaxis protein [Candidatus Zixiibacteriota bacterium]
MNFLHNLSIKSKLSLLVGMFIAGFVIFGLMSHSLLNGLKDGEVFRDVSLGKDLLADVLPPPCYIVESYLVAHQMALPASREALNQHVENLNRLKQDFEARTTFWRDTLAEGDIREKITVTSPELGREFFAVVESEYVPALRRGDYTSARRILDDKLSTLYVAHRKVIDDIVRRENDAIVAADRDAREQIAGSASFTLTVAACVVVACIVFAMIVVAQIVRPIRALAGVADAVAKGNTEQSITVEARDEIGVLARSFRDVMRYMQNLSQSAQRIAGKDLTVEVQPSSDKDILGSSFKVMSDNLLVTIRQVSDNARNVSSAATEVASSAEQMSATAKGQNEQVRSIVASVEDMKEVLTLSAEQTKEAAVKSSTASGAAVEGGKAVYSVVDGMTRINEVVTRAAKTIEGLSTSAEHIGEIIGVIDDIADQTNLLALNAAIEAARAGDQGRGFAVVADEVRKLAERTTKATGEITAMIRGIQNETNDAVSAMHTGIGEVTAGREMSVKAGEKLDQIIRIANELESVIEELAHASMRQNLAAESITSSIKEISQFADENSAGAVQSAQAAGLLNQQATELQRTIEEFRIRQ